MYEQAWAAEGGWIGCRRCMARRSIGLRHERVDEPLDRPEHCMECAAPLTHALSAIGVRAMLHEVRQATERATPDTGQVEKILDETRTRWPDHAELVTRTGARVYQPEPSWAGEIFAACGEGREAEDVVTIESRTYWRIVPSTDDVLCHPELAMGEAVVVETEQGDVVAGGPITNEEWVRLENIATETETEAEAEKADWKS